MCSFLHHKTPTSNPHQYQIDGIESDPTVTWRETSASYFKNIICKCSRSPLVRAVLRVQSHKPINYYFPSSRHLMSTHIINITVTSRAPVMSDGMMTTAVYIQLT